MTGLPVDGGWDSWSVWSECTVTCGCGRGSQIRTRSCDNPMPQYGGNDCVGVDIHRIDCNVPPCKRKFYCNAKSLFCI